MIRHLRILLPLILAYAALSASVEWSAMIIGLLLALFIALLIAPKPRPVNLRRLPRAAWTVMVYLMKLALDVLKNGIILARIVMSPKMPINPGIIAVPSKCDSDLANAVSAHGISVTPGELVVEIGEDGTLYTHCLDATDGAPPREARQKERREFIEGMII